MKTQWIWMRAKDSELIFWKCECEDWNIFFLVTTKTNFTKKHFNHESFWSQIQFKLFKWNFPDVSSECLISNYYYIIIIVLQSLKICKRLTKNKNIVLRTIRNNSEETKTFQCSNLHLSVWRAYWNDKQSPN